MRGAAIRLVLRSSLLSSSFAFETPCLQIIGEFLRDMNDRETLLRFPPVPDVAFIDSFRNSEGTRLVVKALPSKRKQLAWTERVGHIKFEQYAVSKVEFRERQSKLIPGKGRRIHGSQLCWNLDLACGVLHQEF